MRTAFHFSAPASHHSLPPSRFRLPRFPIGIWCPHPSFLAISHTIISTVDFARTPRYVSYLPHISALFENGKKAIKHQIVGQHPGLMPPPTQHWYAISHQQNTQLLCKTTFTKTYQSTNMPCKNVFKMYLLTYFYVYKCIFINGLYL